MGSRSYFSRRLKAKAGQGIITVSMESPFVSIRTDRLEFTSFNQHAKAYLIEHFTKILTNPDNVTYLREGGVWEDAHIEAVIEEGIDGWNNRQFLCDFAVHEIETKKFVGSLIIENASYKFEGHAHAAEIGYFIDNEFASNGYGTEIAIAGKKYIKHLRLESFLSYNENCDNNLKTLKNLNEIVATVHPANIGSKIILERTLKKKQDEQLTMYGGNPRVLFFKSLKPVELELALVPVSSPEINVRSSGSTWK